MGYGAYRVGVDIGGTFTDFTYIDETTGDIHTFKTPTVTEDPNIGILNGLSLLQDNGIAPEDITFFTYGTTIGLNTVLQQKGANIALFVTEGFRDLLNFQRLRLPIPYDFRSRHPEPFIPRSRVFPIKERLRFDGSVATALDQDSVDEAVKKAVSLGVEGIVICFLHSYINPAHEKEAATRISEMAEGVEVNVSSELWPQMREYERAVMTSMNMYIQPKVKRSFQTLTKSMEEANVGSKPFITQSNGGIMNIESAAELPVSTLFSGPAAGVGGALEVARRAKVDNIVTFDVGGTSADISIIEGGHLNYSEANTLAGFPVMLPSVSMYSIGAGGGSYAWIDNGGLLKVGPESVGSTPGPACYGVGDKAALTDAFLICGYLNPASFAGDIKLDVNKSREALRPIADYLQVEVEEAADQMVRVAIANMYAEMSNVMEYQGFDPRDFTLLGFGGAGPVLANMLAKEIQADGVLIPKSPGTLSALGALTADFIHDEIKSIQTLLEHISIRDLQENYVSLIESAKQWLEKQSTRFEPEQELQLSMDARYENQAYEINLPLSMSTFDEKGKQTITDSFHDLHLSKYGHNDPEAHMEIINLRVRIIGSTPEAEPKRVPEKEVEAQPVATRQVVIEGEKYEANVYDRDDLRQNHVIYGPAIIEQNDTTVLILPGWKSDVDPFGNLLLRAEKGEA